VRCRYEPVAADGGELHQGVLAGGQPGWRSPAVAVTTTSRVLPMAVRAGAIAAAVASCWNTRSARRSTARYGRKAESEGKMVAARPAY
jgi:hypothetical protein